MGKFFKYPIIFATIIVFLLAVLACTSFFGTGRSEPLNTSQNNQQNNMDGMKLTSPLFINNGNFPPAHTCDGAETNPPLDISEVPQNAKSLALVLRDPDAPSGIFVHWIVWNIDPATKEIKAGSVPEGAQQGMTTNGKNNYVGPCPPSGTHRYIFTLYALDTKLDLPLSTNAEQLNAAITDHIVGQAELHARYR